MKLRRVIVATRHDNRIAVPLALVLIAIGWGTGYALRGQVPFPWQVLGSVIGLILVAAWQLLVSRVQNSSETTA